MKLEWPAEDTNAQHDYDPDLEGTAAIDFLAGLKKDVREELLSRCVYRAHSGCDPRSTVRLAAEISVRTTLTEELQGKLLFDLPTYSAKATTADADTTTEETEDHAEGE